MDYSSGKYRNRIPAEGYSKISAQTYHALAPAPNNNMEFQRGIGTREFRIGVNDCRGLLNRNSRKFDVFTIIECYGTSFLELRNADEMNMMESPLV